MPRTADQDNKQLTAKMSEVRVVLLLRQQERQNILLL